MLHICDHIWRPLTLRRERLALPEGSTSSLRSPFGPKVTPDSQRCIFLIYWINALNCIFSALFMCTTHTGEIYLHNVWIKLQGRSGPSFHTKVSTKALTLTQPQRTAYLWFSKTIHCTSTSTALLCTALLWIVAHWTLGRHCTPYKQGDLHHTSAQYRVAGVCSAPMVHSEEQWCWCLHANFHSVTTSRAD